MIPGTASPPSRLLRSMITVALLGMVSVFPSFAQEAPPAPRAAEAGPAPDAPPAASAEPSGDTRPSPLEGKRICIDPGHGGAQSGAVGPVDKTPEKDINLAVAKQLRDLLERAGATVFMTRTGDEDVSINDRAKFNRAHDTDLFVSIHHNANAQNDASMNRSEVFWHWHDDGGPSEDAARFLLRELQAAYGLPNSKAYMCWAYGVLRENSYPAILGEASYLANPEEEKRLENPAHLQKQAEAYFRAIEAFFAGGRPQVMLVPGSDPGRTRVLQAAILQPDGLSLLDPQRVRAELDGAPLDPFFFYRADIALAFASLPHTDLSGTHTLTLAARNLAGHTSTVERYPVFFENPWTPPAPPPQARFAVLTVLGRPTPGADLLPLENAEVFGQQVRNVYARTGPDGTLRLDAAERMTPEPHIIAADGYWTREVDLVATKTITLDPLFRGVLHGKPIVVDAEGGGDYPVAIASGGLRAADANLETAFYLADYLRRAGADVSMTRTTDKSMDNVSRVRFGLQHNPDIFLTVGHRLPEPGMNEKPKQHVSRIGSRWDGGRDIGRHMIFHLRQLLGTGESLGDPTSREPLPGEVHNWSSWEVMHAAQEYTAVYVCPQMFDAPGVEDRLATTAGPRKEALAILYGLLDYYGLDDRAMSSLDGIVIDAETGEPLADTLVWLDDTLVTQTEADGRFVFKFLEPGAHRLRAMARDHKLTSGAVEVQAGQARPVRMELNPGSLLSVGHRLQ